MAKLNGYLYRIDATPSDQCACGQARETVEHFLFRCTQWTQQRAELLQCTDTRRSNISFYLGEVTIGRQQLGPEYGGSARNDTICNCHRTFRRRAAAGRNPVDHRY